MVALGIDDFQIRVNNRLVLTGLLEELGLAEQAVPVLRSLDKLPKIGRRPRWRRCSARQASPPKGGAGCSTWP